MRISYAFLGLSGWQQFKASYPDYMYYFNNMMYNDIKIFVDNGKLPTKERRNGNITNNTNNTSTMNIIMLEDMEVKAMGEHIINDLNNVTIGGSYVGGNSITNYYYNHQMEKDM